MLLSLTPNVQPTTAPSDLWITWIIMIMILALLGVVAFFLMRTLKQYDQRLNDGDKKFDSITGKIDKLTSTIGAVLSKFSAQDEINSNITEIKTAVRTLDERADKFEGRIASVETIQTLCKNGPKANQK